jgi:serine/threonine protein kinase
MVFHLNFEISLLENNRGKHWGIESNGDDPDGIHWGESLHKEGQKLFICSYDKHQCIGRRIPIRLLIDHFSFINYFSGLESEISLFKELELMERLSHKNVLSIFKSVMRADEIVLLMPKFSSSLSHEIERRLHLNKFFTVKEMSNLTKQIVEGLEYLHSQGITHRYLRVQSDYCFSQI